MKESLDNRLLELFRQKSGGIVSGEELSAALSVSRTAIWKHIKALQGHGYRIEAVPSQGYRLLAIPDAFIPREIQAGLQSLRIGREIISHAETDSTNTIAYRLAEDGASDGTVVIAETQRQGKGRLGRSWVSPAGVNFYGSIVLRPPIAPVKAFHLTFLSAVAVARSVEVCSGLVPRIKWPNDILVNGKKVAGLLNEMSAETEKIHFVILGIGVNLNMSADQFPGDLRHPATSLMLERGTAVHRLTFARTLLQALDDLYDSYLNEGYGPVRDEWLARSHMLDHRVSISSQAGIISGTVSGIDDQGALLVTLDNGTIERVFSGDVALIT